MYLSSHVLIISRCYVLLNHVVISVSPRPLILIQETEFRGHLQFSARLEVHTLLQLHWTYYYLYFIFYLFWGFYAFIDNTSRLTGNRERDMQQRSQGTGLKPVTRCQASEPTVLLEIIQPLSGKFCVFVSEKKIHNFRYYFKTLFLFQFFAKQ